MAVNLQKRLLEPDGYDQLIRTVEQMRRCGAPPTLMSVELWAHATLEPAGEVARGLARFEATGGAFLEDAVIALSRRLLAPRRRESEIRQTIGELSRQLEAVGAAVLETDRSIDAYRRVVEVGVPALQGSGLKPLESSAITGTIAAATHRVLGDVGGVERRLQASAVELQRLSESLSAGRPRELTDALTSLPNRRGFDVALDDALAALARAPASDATLVLAYVEIDNLEAVSAKWGAKFADDVIRYVGAVLAPLGCAPGLIARNSLETFAVLIRDTTLESAVVELDQARLQISERRLTRRSDRQLIEPVTVSIGVAPVRSRDTRTWLLERVERALSMSKKRGGNHVSALDRMESRMAKVF